MSGAPTPGDWPTIGLSVELAASVVVVVLVEDDDDVVLEVAVSVTAVFVASEVLDEFPPPLALHADSTLALAKRHGTSARKCDLLNIYFPPRCKRKLLRISSA